MLRQTTDTIRKTKICKISSDEKQEKAGAKAEGETQRERERERERARISIVKLRSSCSLIRISNAARGGQWTQRGGQWASTHVSHMSSTRILASFAFFTLLASFACEKLC